jgi:hypothetical protein
MRYPLGCPEPVFPLFSGQWLGRRMLRERNDDQKGKQNLHPLYFKGSNLENLHQ